MANLHSGLDKSVNAVELRQMESWLQDKGLGKYAATFVQHEVYNLNDLSLLTAEDLNDMGITAIGARRKLLCYTAQIKGDMDTFKDSNFKSLPPLPIRPVTRREPVPSIHSTEEAFSPTTQDEVASWREETTRQGTPIQESQIVPAAEEDNLDSSQNSAKEKSQTGSVLSEGLPQIVEPQSSISSRSNSGLDKINMRGLDISLFDMCKELESEKEHLSDINEAASLLLSYEKEDSVANENYVPGKLKAAHTLSVDVDFFKQRIQRRIDHFMKDPTPPESPRTEAIEWMRSTQYLNPAQRRRLSKPNYQVMINQQTAHNQEVEKAHARYQELLTSCLTAVQEDMERHWNVGEYRDVGEYRLKVQLARLIGIENDATKEETKDDDAEFRARMGITDATLRRRRTTQHELDELVKALDKDGKGLLSHDAIREACEKDTTMKRRVSQLAFNLALDPENRFLADDDKLNQHVQGELERIANKVEAGEDGLISAEAITTLSPKSRHALSKMGLPNIYHT